MATDLVINSDNSLSHVLGVVRQIYKDARYVKVRLTTGRARSLNTNNLSHAWYEQISKELQEDSPAGVKRTCKRNYGVPILCAEDPDFRERWEPIERVLTYEQQVALMDQFDVTSTFTKAQMSEYLQRMQDDFRNRDVYLEFPKDQAA